MKHYTLHLCLSLGLMGILSSCSELIDDFIRDKVRNEYHDYLRNETDQDVTVIFNSKGDDRNNHTYLVPRGKTVEIPDAERLGVSLRALERDSVVFVFADGMRVVHTYTNTSFGKDMYSFVYEPAVNNIFYTGYDIQSADDSWVKTMSGTMRFRFEYTITGINKTEL